ncbi:MAG: hypothetical protein AAGA67_12080, partial [Cyanobacteria bacterium P01_F01_bin.153]
NTGAATDITYPLASREDGTWDVEIASDGTGFVTTDFAGSGWTPLRQLNTATDTLVERTDSAGSGFGGQVRQKTHIAASANRDVLYFTESNISSGPTFTYDATTSGREEDFLVNLSNPTNAAIGDGEGRGTIRPNQFPAEVDTSSFHSDAISGVSRDGELVAVERFPDDIRIFDRSLNGVDTLTGLNGGFSFDPARDVLYAIDSDRDEITAYNTDDRSQLYRFAVGEDFSNFVSTRISTSFGSGNMSFTQEGDLMFLSTPTGIRIYDLPDFGNYGVTLGAGQRVSGLDFGLA